MAKEETIEKNVHDVAWDLLSLMNSFREAYTMPLTEHKVPNKEVLGYLESEIKESAKKVKDIELGEYQDVFNQSYGKFKLMINNYMAVESRDIAQAIGKKDETDGTTKLLQDIFNCKIATDVSQTELHSLAESVDDLVGDYHSNGEAFILGGHLSNKLSGKEQKPMIGNPLRDSVVEVMGKIDGLAFYTSNRKNTSLLNFINGTNALIELSQAKNYPYK
tara:strand:+ start:52 stop:708 length:657 start_codon:yes stop_codon:yes gene_type:complete